MLIETSKKQKVIFTVEDGVLSGGLGSGILEFYNKKNIKTHVNVIAYDDKFITHGEVDELLKINEMHSEGIAARIEKKLKDLK